MGRPERSLDPDQDPVARFAADLRALRRDAGAPTYRQMAQRVHFSASALSQAASGHRLPTLPVLLGFVDACRGDAAEWRTRWQALASPAEQREAPSASIVSTDAPIAPQDVPVVPTDVPVAPTDAPIAPQDVPVVPTDVPVRRRRTVVLAGAAAFVLVAASVAAGTLLVGHDRAPAATRAQFAVSPKASEGQSIDLPSQPVADGSDPKRSGCAPDAITIGSTSLFFPGTRLAGSVELRFSPSCSVAWVRFVPAPTGRAQGDTVTVETVRPSDGAKLPFTISYGDESVYGDVLLTTKGCVQAQASIATGGQTSPTVATKCKTGP